VNNVLLEPAAVRLSIEHERRNDDGSVRLQDAAQARVIAFAILLRCQKVKDRVIVPNVHRLDDDDDDSRSPLIPDAR